ncbi:MAG: hypothetical protein J0H49_10685 [Acidobacteria bacterium]|nr:hypothetical protein [Acidobacteriota bacterium]
MAFPFLTVIARMAVYEIYRRASLLSIVNRDFAGEVANQGDTVKVILPETPTVQDAGGVFAADAASPSVIDVKLDKWRETKPIKVDMATISKADRDVLGLYATPIAEALMGDVEAAILAEFAATANALNDPAAGTVVPSGIDGIGVELKAKFDALKAPIDGRFVVAGANFEAEYWKAFGTTSTGSVDQMIAGTMGTKLGQTYLSVAAAENGARLGYGVHKNAIALVSRPVKPSPLAPNTMAVADYNGLGITIEMWHDPGSSCDLIKGQFLYGTKAVTGKMFKVGKKAA